MKVWMGNRMCLLLSNNMCSAVAKQADIVKGEMQKAKMKAKARVDVDVNASTRVDVTGVRKSSIQTPLWADNPNK